MESLFFNTPKECYKITKKSFYEQVDISNGILFYDINTNSQKRKIEFNYIDKMLFIVLVESGEVIIRGNSFKKVVKSSSIATLINIASPFEITIKSSSKLFILFIADFFLKRYLSYKDNEPIDFVYNKLKGKEALSLINLTPLDAFSLYLANKIKLTSKCINLQSIKCMYRCLEFIVHNLDMLDIIDSSVSLDEQQIAKRAKDILLKSYTNAPTIAKLAKMCATNEFKLKRAFKNVYKITIYGYIQKLRLERANLLLKEDTLSIKEVAKSVGYNHSGYFAKLFFKTYGVYPKDII